MKRNVISGKVSIIGAGNVGAALAQLILEQSLADIILVDIDEGISKGKAFDLQDASSIMGYEKNIDGTSDYSKIGDSSVVVVTAGFPRKPGMSRDDLLKKNGSVVKDVSLKVKEFAPDSILIMVTNPVDAMSYFAYKTTGFDRRRILGMAGILDSARCSIQAASQLGVTQAEVDSVVIGSHDGNMIPLFAHSKAQGKTFKSLFDVSKQNEIIERTKKRGTEIVSLLKSASAFFAPSAACFSMVKSILKNEHLTLCASVYLDGEYGLRDIFIGVPVVLGRDGIEKIVELELSQEEARNLKKAAEEVKGSIAKLNA